MADPFGWMQNQRTDDIPFFKASGEWAPLHPPTSSSILTHSGSAGGLAWTPKNTAITHTVLDASVHTDTVAQTVSRGSLIYGNSTPKWDELTIGSANKVLHSDGTDASWQSISTADLGVAFPAWTAYTPTVTSGSGTITTSSSTGRYLQVGQVLFFEMSITITTNGTGGTYVGGSLPAAAIAESVVAGRDNGLSGKMLAGFINVASAAVFIQFYDATYPGANGARLSLSGCIEV